MPLSVSIVGEGRPVVLLPGFGLDGSVMAAACEPVFSKTTGHQRIYVDLPGTGGSPAGEPTSEAVLTAVRATVADLIGDTPYRLVGHSYGGYLATGLARRDPGRIAGMLLICCGLRIVPADRDLTGVRQSAPEPGWLDGVPDDLREHFRQAIGRQTRSIADRVTAVLAGRGPLDEAYLDELRPVGYQLPDENHPNDYPGPVSILAGGRDRVAGYRDAFEALSHYPHAGYSVLAEAGHYLPFEEPETFATHALGWLASTR